MLDLLRDPYSWFAASAVVGCATGYFGTKWFIGAEFERNGYDPIDYDALQRELDEEFAPVKVRAK